MTTENGGRALCKESCRGCDRKVVLEKLYDGYYIDKTRLGDICKDHETRYTSLCGKCRDEAHVNEKVYIEKGKLYDKHVTTLKEEVAHLTEEMTKLREASATRSNEGELKRKHSEETNVVNNASTESETKECIICKGTKPLSMFQSKHRQKIKGGKIAEYLTTRKKCKSCRNKEEYNRAKKARISPVDNLCAEKEPEDGVIHQEEVEMDSPNKESSLEDDIEEEKEPQFYPDDESSGDDHVVNSILYMGKIYNPDLAIGKL